MGKSNAADLDDLQILTYQIVRGKLTVTEYLDASTGEILSAEEAKRLGLTVSRSEARAKRQRKLDALRVEVRAFALFVLAFRNRRSGLMRIPTNVTACTDDRDRVGLRASVGFRF
ncbi:MAG: hypothetical protein AzoDbin1_05313 [Azoarcus sp.]|nr:hypothetical protein [Azoarcus sp.]